MQRIYGYALLPRKEELDQHLHRLEEAKRRDHRKLGRELDLFSVSDETGAGLILWHPKGGFVRTPGRGLLARGAPEGRLRHRLQPPRGPAGPLEDVRAHRVLPREHVRAHGRRERADQAEADELPGPHRDLQEPAPELPRAAGPLRGARHRLPLRAFGCAARPGPRPRIHPGRLPPSSPAGPARGRGGAGPGLHDRHPEGIRLRAVRHLPLDPSLQVHGHRRAVGDGDCRSQEGPRKAQSPLPGGSRGGRLLRTHRCRRAMRRCHR